MQIKNVLIADENSFVMPIVGAGDKYIGLQRNHTYFAISIISDNTGNKCIHCIDNLV